MAFKSSLLNNNSNFNTSSNTNDIPSITMVDIDSEPVITIDADLRKITIPDELYNIGVVGDHLAETIYFSCPRYFDGNDLSQHTCIIRCINAGKEYFEDSVVEMTVNNETLMFGWKIDNRVTRYSGVINFTIQFETIFEGIKYQWQTIPADLNILSGLNIEETISEKDTILFRTLSNQVQSLQQQVDSLNTQIVLLPTLIEKINKLTTEFEYLKNNVVYICDDNG